MSHPSTLPQSRPLRSRRILELDALRGLAAVAVVCFHYTTRYEQLFGHRESLAVCLPGGHYGVDLFFMLSGFVILMTLERTADSWRFAWGRITRLYPTYWTAVALTFICVSCFGLPGQEVSWAEAWLNLTMVQALLGAGHVDGAYWSLQAELIFYANMLVLYRLGAFQKTAATVLSWLVLACVVHGLQAHAENAWPLLAAFLSKLATIASLKFIPLFGIGILLYQAHRADRCSVLGWASLLGCLGVVGWREGGLPLAVDTSLAALLWLAIRGRLPLLASRPLVGLGAISYSLYLTHQNIGYILIRSLENQGVGSFTALLITTAVAICLGACLHRWIERPSMHVCRKLDFPAIARRVKMVAVNS